MPTDREGLFEPNGSELSRSQSEKRSNEAARNHLGRAMCWAASKHAGQVDKSGHPYIEHAVRVSGNCSWHSIEAMVVGMLHDVVEDTDATVMMVEVMFDKGIARAVEAITHMPNEPHVDYMQRVRSNGLARVAKLADFADNASPDRMIDDARHAVRLERYRAGITDLLAIDGWQMDAGVREWYEERSRAE